MTEANTPQSPYGYGQARKVLQDVIWLRERLEVEEDYTAWRLYWINCVTLLRTVGQVAEKVDGRTHPSLLEATRQVYKTWRKGEEHKIYRDFIDRQRNLILKEYETGMSEGPIPVTVTMKNPDGGLSGYQALIGENTYRPMKDGPWEGEDGRELIDQAIRWWKSQIRRMEEIVDRIESCNSTRR